MSSLGIIDWGIGGISIYKLIKERRPGTSVVYFSDTGVTPYGKMSRAELIARLETVLNFLRTCGVTHVVIGCNAASTALPFLKTNGLPVEGVIESAVEMAVKAKPGLLGLIGGRRTVLSHVYSRAFAKRGIKVKQRVAQPLSGLIESGDTGSQRLREESRRILAPLSNCSHILLACTHYPAIADVLRGAVSPQTKFLDPATSLVDKIVRWKVDGDGRDLFLTTGDARAMKHAALAAFECDIGRATKIRI